MGTDIDIGADVYTVHGHKFGKVSAVVLNPGHDEITHIVVRRGFVFPIDVVLPMDTVREVTDHRVNLSIGGRVAARMPTFEASASEPLEVSDQDASGLGPRGEPNIWAENPIITLPPLLSTATNVQPYVVEYWRNIPEQSLVLRDGLPVRASDGAVVGELDELVTDPATHAVTDIVVRQDRVLGHRKAVPVGWIERSDERSGIVLAVDKEKVAALRDHH
jgi:sporulation protein YlmC with PRC-barrel domain